MEDLKKNKIVKAVVEKKMPLKEIAKKLFISERQLLLLLDSWGVEIPRRKRHNVPMPPRMHLMEVYAKQGNSQKAAKFFGVSIGTVVRWMKAMDIPMRKMGKMNKEEKVNYLEKHLGKLENFNL